MVVFFDVCLHIRLEEARVFGRRARVRKDSMAMLRDVFLARYRNMVCWCTSQEYDCGVSICVGRLGIAVAERVAASRYVLIVCQHLHVDEELDGVSANATHPAMTGSESFVPYRAIASHDKDGLNVHCAIVQYACQCRECHVNAGEMCIVQVCLCWQGWLWWHIGGSHEGHSGCLHVYFVDSEC